MGFTGDSMKSFICGGVDTEGKTIYLTYLDSDPNYPLVLERIPDIISERKKTVSKYGK